MSPPSRNAKLAQMLLRSGAVNRNQLGEASRNIEAYGSTLDVALASLNILSEDKLLETLSRLTSAPVVEWLEVSPAPQVLAILDATYCEQHGIFPCGLDERGKTLLLAMSDPTDLDAIDFVSNRSRARVKPGLASERVIGKAIRRWYYNDATAMDTSSGEFKLVDRSGKTIHPTSASGTAVAAEPSAQEKTELLALKAAVESQERTLRALVDVLMQRRLITADDLLKARKAAQAK